MRTLSKMIFNPFEDDLDKQLFLPAIKNAIRYDCMIGYFSISSIQVLSKSIYFYLNSNIYNKLRLIVSPNFSKEDLELLSSIYNDKIDIEKLENFTLSRKILLKETFKVIAFLIKFDRLEIKIALPQNGLFHVKCWLISQQDGSEFIIQGSSNHTKSGLSRNFEYLVVNHIVNSEQDIVYCKIRQDFNLLWQNKYPNVICCRLNQNVVSTLLSYINEDLSIKSFDRFNLAIALKHAIMNDKENSMKMLDEQFNIDELLEKYQLPCLTIPEWLNYKDGDYAHQGEAIDAWFENDKTGILSIATGGGKTLTSLTTATLLSKELDKLLLIIAVPTKALMVQWEEEVSLFGINAINLNHYSSVQDKKNKIEYACKNLKFNSSKVEAIIISHDALKSMLMDKIKKYAHIFPTMLIADEVHNLGSIGFRENAPDFFSYKLGLSATPIRQYDEEGSEFLLEYFGDVVYEYGLEQAIGTCLVPFDYYAHQIQLTEEESDEFYELTQKIKKLSFAVNTNPESIEYQNWSKLCIRRRKIIEVAENKIFAFSNSFPHIGSKVKNVLIFCSDKQPEQLDKINKILLDRYINFHQITSEETANNLQLKQIIQAYNEGKIQVLTSKRVLDEGFNVPQTKTAYILASNTTKKQWVQRLGRVLRKCEDKNKAEIHDYIVLPMINGILDDDFKSMLKSEAERIQFFITYSSNGCEQNGAVHLLGKIGDMLQRGKEY